MENNDDYEDDNDDNNDDDANDNDIDLIPDNEEVDHGTILVRLLDFKRRSLLYSFHSSPSCHCS